MSTQPKALAFADDRPISLDFDLYQWAKDAEDLLRTQHADLERKDALLRQALEVLDAVDMGFSVPLEVYAAIKQELAK